MGQNERMWSQDRRISQCESPPPLLSALQRGQRAEAPIYKFVLTGGPCAGKTTSLDRLSTYFRYFTSHGFCCPGNIWTLTVNRTAAQ